MEYTKLKPLVDQVKGTTFAGIDTLVEVKLKGGKKNPMQGRVTKLTTGSNVLIFSNVEFSPYEAMVKRRMVSEGKNPDEFSVGKRAWGSRVEKSPFIEHNGKHYLEVIFKSGGESVYMLDGKPIAKEMIEGLDDQPKESSEESQGGISEKIIIRTYSLDSIQNIRLMGETVSA